jgi:hypothetical protein
MGERLNISQTVHIFSLANDFRNVINGEIYRTGNKARAIGFCMKDLRLFHHRFFCHGYPWMERDFPELATAIRVFVHYTNGVIDIIQHDNSILGAKVEIPEHVASGYGRNKEVFRRVTARVAAKCRVR